MEAAQVRVLCRSADQQTPRDDNSGKVSQVPGAYLPFLAASIFSESSSRSIAILSD